MTEPVITAVFDPRSRNSEHFELLTLQDRFTIAARRYLPGVQSLVSLAYPRGWDLSRWNTIDEDLIEGDFIILKASESDWYEDPTFDERWPRLLDRGVRLGAYHFFRGDRDGLDQAHHFLETIEPLRRACEGRMIIAGDFETADGVTMATRQVRGGQFLAELHGEFRLPHMYSSKYLWETLYGNPSWAGTYRGWLAQWANISAPSAIPVGWNTDLLDFWQYGIWNDYPWCDPVIGAQPDIDVNYYLGTQAELDALIGIEQPEPLPSRVRVKSNIAAQSMVDIKSDPPLWRNPPIGYVENGAVLDVIGEVEIPDTSKYYLFIAAVPAWKTEPVEDEE